MTSSEAVLPIFQKNYGKLPIILSCALEVILNVMRSINPRFTYLLTYCVGAETIADDGLYDDAEMLSEEDFERASIYHVPDRPCPPYTWDRIRKTLPSNLVMLPSASEPHVS